MTALYGVTDDNANPATDQAVLSIEVFGGGDPTVPQPPVAIDDVAITEQDVDVSGNVIDPNDFDLQGEDLTVTSVLVDTDGDGEVDDALPLNTPTTVFGVNSQGDTVVAGVLTLTADGSFDFDPEPNFTGEVLANYTITNDSGLTDDATLSIQVVPDTGNQTFASDDSNVGPAGLTLTGDVLTNDFDPEGDGQMVTGATDSDGNAITVGVPFTLPSGGTFLLNADGSYEYTPAPGFVGTEVIPYAIVDNDGAEPATAFATLYLTTVPLVPEVIDVQTFQNVPVTVCLDLSELTGDLVALESCGDASNGTVGDLDLSTGCVTYTPDLNYLGTDDFCVLLVDENGVVDTAFVNVEVVTDTANVACISDLNVTLNDDCEFTLIASQVLRGMLPTNANDVLQINVIDGIDNGPIVDGCGVYNYQIMPLDGATIVGFTGCWGRVFAEDKTPPTVVADVAGSTLLCVDVTVNRLDLLPATVDRCYQVNSVTGATIPGSMDPALRQVLSQSSSDDVPGAPAIVPTFFDGCSGLLEVCVSDVFTPSANGCGDDTLLRTFTATELSQCGNATPQTAAVSTLTMTFERPTLDDLDGNAIAPVVNIEQCGIQNPTVIDYPAPRPQDFPFLQVGTRTFPLASGTATCGIGVTFSDSAPIQTCDFTYKFVRTYTVIDWCDPSDRREFTQIVKVGDDTPPVISGPTQDLDLDGVPDAGPLVFGTNTAGCEARVRLDGAGVGALDNCSGTNVTLTATVFSGTQPVFGLVTIDLNNGAAEVTDPLALGAYTVVYTAEDACGNTTSLTVPFTVVDGAGPVAICEDAINVSLGRQTGVAVITPSLLDAGSYDGCSQNLDFEIARVGTFDFDDQIVFECADVGVNVVTLLITDELGNENTCDVDVNVTLDQNDTPVCIAPSAVTINCVQYAAVLPPDITEATDAELDAAFGFATGIGTCGATVTSDFRNNNLNDCGLGTIERVYTVTGSDGTTNVNNCVQLITIEGIFDYQVVLPGDARATAPLEPTLAQVTVANGACDDIVVDSSRDTIFGGAGCVEVEITHTIINLCEYDGSGLITIDRSGLVGNAGNDAYLNVLAGSANTQGDDIAFTSSAADRQFRPATENDVEIAGYAANANRGGFEYVQTITVFDRTSPTVSVLNAPTDCISGCNDVDFDLDVVIGDEFMTPTLTATFTNGSVAVLVPTSDSTFTVSASGLSAGPNDLTLTVTDVCGNVTTEIVVLEVCGDVAPAPICIQILTATLAPDGNGGGINVVPARDFVIDGFTDCFGNQITDFGILFGSDVPSLGDSTITVTCDDLGSNPVTVASFSAGNGPEICSTILVVEEGLNVNCGGGGGNVSGLIATQDDREVADVMVAASSSGPDVMTTTDVNGMYTFTNLTLGDDYTIQPNHAIPVDLTEVKISDVVKIASTILGTSSFDNGYDFIAADVDQSGSVNVLDMVGIQRVILGIDATFAAGDTWRFVTADHNLTTSNWMMAFPEVYNANDLQGNQFEVDFVAVELGNVVRTGSRSSLNLEIDDVKLESGQSHDIEIRAGELAGFQGTLDLGGNLLLEDIAFDGLLSSSDVNLTASDLGLIGVAYHGAMELDELLLTLKVKAIRPGLLSDLLSATDELVYLEGVDRTGGSTGLGLAFTRSTLAPATAHNALYQNLPNPVVDQTTIGFELAQAGPATLTVRDAAGRLLLTRKVEAAAGRNQIRLQQEDLGASGTLTYTLTSGDFSATKQMIVLNR